MGSTHVLRKKRPLIGTAGALARNVAGAQVAVNIALFALRAHGGRGRPRSQQKVERYTEQLWLRRFC